MTLFGDPEPIGAHRTRREDMPTWTASATRAACDECQLAQHAGAKVPARKAQMRRRTKHTDRRLCYAHAQPLREADEAMTKLSALKIKR